METILESPAPVCDATAAGGEAPPDGFLFASLFGIRNRHLTHQKNINYVFTHILFGTLYTHTIHRLNSEKFQNFDF